MTVVGARAVPMRLLANSAAGEVMTDRDRWAAFQVSAEVTRVIDARTGRASDRPVPAGCEGGLTAVGGGKLLYRCSFEKCPDGSTPDPSAKACNAGDHLAVRYVIVDAATGAAQEGPRAPPARDGLGSAFLQNVGARWVQGVRTSCRSAATPRSRWSTSPGPRGSSSPAAATGAS